MTQVWRKLTSWVEIRLRRLASAIAKLFWEKSVLTVSIFGNYRNLPFSVMIFLRVRKRFHNKGNPLGRLFFFAWLNWKIHLTIDFFSSVFWIRHEHFISAKKESGKKPIQLLKDSWLCWLHEVFQAVKENVNGVSAFWICWKPVCLSIFTLQWYMTNVVVVVYDFECIDRRSWAE